MIASRICRWIGVAACLCVAAAPSAMAAEPLASLDLTLAEHGKPAPFASTTLHLDAKGGLWKPPDAPAPPFVRVRSVWVNQEMTAVDRDEPIDVFIAYEFSGAEEPDRRVLVDFRMRDEAGQVLHRAWELDQDQRIYARAQNNKSSRIHYSSQNHTRFEIPTRDRARLRSVAIEFRSMRPEEWHHVAPEPSDIDLAMTHPDPEGRFALLFTNPDAGTPDAWALDPSAHQVAVSLSVRDAGGKHRETIVRILDARREGRYRVAFRAPPECLDHSSVHIDFFAKQPDNEAFVRSFFLEGRGSTYRGLWHGSGARFIEVPFRGD